jgi:hypothetical protein
MQAIQILLGAVHCGHIARDSHVMRQVVESHVEFRLEVHCSRWSRLLYGPRRQRLRRRSAVCCIGPSSARLLAVLPRHAVHALYATREAPAASGLLLVTLNLRAGAGVAGRSQLPSCQGRPGRRHVLGDLTCRAFPVQAQETATVNKDTTLVVLVAAAGRDQQERLRRDSAST